MNHGSPNYSPWVASPPQTSLNQSSNNLKICIIPKVTMPSRDYLFSCILSHTIQALRLQCIFFNNYFSTINLKFTDWTYQKKDKKEKYNIKTYVFTHF